MKVSIITVVFNNKNTMQSAIESVLSQDYDNIEYIVVDGGSTDGTLDVIDSYKDNIDILISEPDKGIYDAMNKGILRASGDIIGILNSDDFYAENDIISIVVKTFKEQNVDSVYADLEYVQEKDTNNVVRYWRSKKFRDGLFKNGWQLAHPTFFVKKEIYEKYGLFNLEFTLAADYELMLRLLNRYKVSSVYVPKVFVRMRVGGASNKSIRNIIKANIESYKAWEANGLKISYLRFLLKPLSKILQYVKR